MKLDELNSTTNVLDFFRVNSELNITFNSPVKDGNGWSIKFRWDDAAMPGSFLVGGILLEQGVTPIIRFGPQLHFSFPHEEIEFLKKEVQRKQFVIQIAHALSHQIVKKYTPTQIPGRLKDFLGVAQYGE